MEFYKSVNVCCHLWRKFLCVLIIRLLLKCLASSIEIAFNWMTTPCCRCCYHLFFLPAIVSMFHFRLLLFMWFAFDRMLSVHILHSHFIQCYVCCVYDARTMSIYCGSPSYSASIKSAQLKIWLPIDNLIYMTNVRYFLYSLSVWHHFIKRNLYLNLLMEQVVHVIVQLNDLHLFTASSLLCTPSVFIFRLKCVLSFRFWKSADDANSYSGQWIKFRMYLIKLWSVLVCIVKKIA